MQTQIHSYAFQLQEECIATSLVSHPKELTFFSTAYNPTQNISYLYTLKYNEENPRKSILCAQKTEGKINKLFNFMGSGYSQVEEGEEVSSSAMSIMSVCDGNKFRVMLGGCNREVTGNAARIDKQDIIDLNGFEEIASYQQKVHNFIYKQSNKGVYWNTDNTIYEYQKGNEPTPIRTIQNQQGKDLKLTHLKIDPIHDYLTYALTDNTIHILDKSLKNMKYQLQLTTTPYEPVLNIDYNRNKQYYLMSTHPSSIKFWDIRKPSLPVKLLLGEQAKHSLLLTAAYNYSHDELVTAGFDDGTVGLYRMTSVSSVPNKDEQDVLVRLYDEHEDSVYCLEWSEYSPWVFGSVAYGAGNIVINLVPNVEKYRILL